MLAHTALAIVGATASGKTDISLALATTTGIQAEIVCADSRQIFTYLDIGTTKPTLEEQALVPHHCIDILKPDQHCSAGAYAEIARPIIEDILQRGRLPIIVGGSGLYIKALCEGFFSMPPHLDIDMQSIREQLQSDVDKHGIDWLYQELQKVDSASCTQYSDKNPRRLMRALEFYRATGWRFSEKKSEMESLPTFNTVYCAREMPRDELYGRINKRTEIMWEGVLEETKKILEMGYPFTLNALNTVGYKEAIACIYGDMTSIEAMERMKQSTRNYAKRQLTWFRGNPNIHWLSGTEEYIAKKALELMG